MSDARDCKSVTLRVHLALVDALDKHASQAAIAGSVANDARDGLGSYVWANGTRYSVTNVTVVQDILPEYAAGDDVEVFEENDQGTFEWQPGKVVKIINNLVRVQTSSGCSIYYDRNDTVIRKPATQIDPES